MRNKYADHKSLVFIFLKKNQRRRSHLKNKNFAHSKALGHRNDYMETVASRLRF
jgi:hypothetical protein